MISDPLQRQEWKYAAYLAGIFLLVWWAPLESERFNHGIKEALALSQWYAREHVILCLLPAFLIAGAITTFIQQGSVIKYLNSGAHKVAGYAVASISGAILAVCSCTVLPLFAGIYRMGAGLGPATTFLYSGPAISALAIVMSSKVLGIEMGLARSLGAIGFSIVIGLLMATIFKKDEEKRQTSTPIQTPESDGERPFGQILLLIGLQVGILIVANWGESESPFFALIYSYKWYIVAILAGALALQLALHFGCSKLRLSLSVASVLIGGLAAGPLTGFCLGLAGLAWVIAGSEDDMGEWWRQSWSFTKLVMPLLLIGVMVTGLLIGRPGHEAWIPELWLNNALGGDGILPILFASLAGSLMYFATLTEIPIVEALQGAGMGNGAALALLLAGPALSLPNMLVIRSILGTSKTLTYIALVVVFSTVAGWLIGPII